MTILLIILLVGVMGMTGYVLVRGVIGMASGREGNAAAQQQWMRKRVFYQAIAIGIAAIILSLAGARGH